MHDGRSGVIELTMTAYTYTGWVRTGNGKVSLHIDEDREQLRGLVIRFVKEVLWRSGTKNYVDVCLVMLNEDSKMRGYLVLLNIFYRTACYLTHK